MSRDNNDHSSDDPDSFIPRWRWVAEAVGVVKKLTEQAALEEEQGMVRKPPLPDSPSDQP